MQPVAVIPLEFRALKLRAPLAGYVSDDEVIVAKSRRCAVPSVRVTTRVKKRAVFHLSSGVIFESGRRLIMRNLAVYFP